jgi:type I restriction enzyme S subunit
MIDLGSAKPKTDALLQRFDRLVDHPDGILQLRRLILSLAIQGRLVERNPSDRPAAVSFPRLALAAVEPDDDTYPAHWLRVPLRQMGEWRGGGTPSKSRPEFWQGKLPWVSPKDMKLLRISDAQDHISKAAVEDSAVRLIPEGSLLMVVRGMILARAFPVALTTREVTINQDMKALLPSEPDTTDFLLVALRAFEPVVLAAIERSTHGTCKLETETLHALATPVPPLAEQKRIVAKVDELMALCDRLEAQLHERDTRQAALARAALARFADAPTPANLELLFHDSFTITPADLRKTILQLAVEGRLAHQDPDEGKSIVEFQRIQERKAELLRAKQIGKPAQGRPINPADIDYDIPESWVWARLIDICELITDGTHQTPKYAETGRMFLSAQNVKPFKFMPQKHRLVSEGHYQGYVKNVKPTKGDVLLTRVGAGIGEAATIDQDLHFAIYVSLGLVRPVRGSVFPDYITLWLNSPDGTAKSSRNTYGKGVSQGNLNLSLIRDFLVPLPPLAEQRRIVARVDQLMALVDQWESQLAATSSTADRLLSTLITEVTKAP